MSRSKSKSKKPFQALLRTVRPASPLANKTFLHWLLRSSMLAEQRKRLANSGFVLPTTMLLLLTTSLVVGAMVYRASNRSQEVVKQRQQQVIYNAATPAIDRAKAKLEVLFDKKKETRITAIVPAEQDLDKALRNYDNETGFPTQKEDPAGNEFYTLPGETRLDIGNGLAVNGESYDRGWDNAWYYRTDLNGDGTEDATIAYSILFNTPEDEADLTKQDDAALQSRAANLQVRHGPYSPEQNLNSPCKGLDIPAGAPGWFPDATSSSILRKNFQVNAIVIPDAGGNNALTTLEFQQDRKLIRGNKWGAWFRNDLELHPGPEFKWNGAMHTEGSLVLGNSRFKSFLVSSPASCLDIREASTVSVTERFDDNSNVSFQAQFISGISASNSIGGKSEHHLYNANNPKNPTVRELNSGTDSIASGKPLDISLDPIVLFTEDRNEARGSDPTAQAQRDGGWEGSDFVKKQRMKNQEEQKPFVDDTYRADNRYGPKPAYTADLTLVSEGARTGDDIPAGETILLNNDPGTVENPQELGLDGYWERRAKLEGLKVLVGQRLELGNTFGWGFDMDEDGQPGGGPFDYAWDVLYPPSSDDESADQNTMSHEDQQRRLLRDNLAAVQGAAVYHYQVNGGESPVACVAATSHFASPQAIFNSLDFSQPNPETLRSDFFNGKGTSGWEYEPPNPNTFPNATLLNALENLAHFAGDPDGAFPPLQESGTDIDHPYRYLRMWGDFSNLRRALELGNYASLSIADRTYLDTAACTLGMLAQNILEVEDQYNTIANDKGNAGLVALGQHFWQLVDGNSANGEVNELVDPPVPFPPGYKRNQDATDFYGQFTPEDFIEALFNKPGLGSQAKKEELIRRARNVGFKTQLDRDRTLGFSRSRYVAPPGTGSSIPWDELDGLVTEGNGNKAVTLKLSCDPNIFKDRLTGGGGGLDQKAIGLALAFCSSETRPKYPALYYVFPKQDHNHDGSGNALAADDQPRIGHPVPENDFDEPYVSDSYIANTINSAYTYQEISDADLNDIALQPRASAADWVLPNKAPDADDPNLILDPAGNPLAVPFLDRTIFDGRELMISRTLDVDIDMLRQTQPPAQTPNPNNLYDFYQFGINENWLPVRGIVYAFREDAMREDALARPAANNNCGSGLPCGDGRDLNDLRDPDIDALNATGNGISIKPVDYYPDPERRPHGFRLLNGEMIKREQTPPGGPDVSDTNIFGISFISDNPVYIQGDFNMHSTNGSTNEGDRLEEFTQKLSPNFSFTQFYNRTNLDPRFARPTTDTWRPSEIISDAIGVLSGNFCEGSAQDLFLTAGDGNPATDAMVNYDAYTGNGGDAYPIRLGAGGCGNRNGTSFLGALWLRNQSQGGNTIQPDQWVREDAAETGNTDTAASPVKLSPRGNPIYQDGTTFLEYDRSDNRSYRAISDNRRRDRGIARATETRVNAIIVSGLVPTRAKQGYGGLHNFPRFIENWSGTPLNIAGSFLQLNFSSYGTGPQDQDAWEPNQSASNSTRLAYYSPPLRRWGYDVGLQYAPAGPVAERFVSGESIRSEFYNEPPANDTYVFNLCQAVVVASGSSKVCPSP